MNDIVVFREFVSEILKKALWNATVIGQCEPQIPSVKPVYIVFIDNELFIIDENLKYDVVQINYSDISGAYLYIYEDEIEDAKVIDFLRNRFKLNKSQLRNFLEHIDSFVEMKGKYLKECENLKKENYPLINNYIKSYYKNYMQIDDFDFEKFNTVCRGFLSKFELDNRYGESVLPFKFEDFLEIIKEKGNFNESHDKFLKLAVLLCFKEVIINDHANKFYSFFEDPSLLNVETVEKLIDMATKNPLWCANKSENLWHLICFYIQSKGIARNVQNQEIVDLYSSADKYLDSELKNRDLLNLKSELERQFTEITVREMATIDDTDLMSGVEFEDFIALLFEKMGYFITKTVATGDQGIDLIAMRNNMKIGIQVKRYSDKVTNKAVQEVVAGITHHKLNKGMVVTNNYYTPSAKELANSNDIVLWDREMLKIKIKELS